MNIYLKHLKLNKNNNLVSKFTIAYIYSIYMSNTLMKTSEPTCWVYKVKVQSSNPLVPELTIIIVRSAAKQLLDSGWSA